MEVGYAFLKMRPGEKIAVIKRVREVDGVKEAHLTLGIFDAIIRVEGETVERIERIYLNKVEGIPGIVSSRLHIVACPRTRK
jgi:Lrp/AsnC family transcriptional regulator for asnA, asnC and gidA